MNAEDLALAPMWYVAFLLSLTCHEAAHALAAKWGGDLTAFHGGQVSLNPLPHVQREPFGTVLVPWLSYFLGGSMLGWGSAPYDPFWEQRYPRRAAWMALAGPIANFLLLILAAILIRVGLAMGAFVLPQGLAFTRLIDAANPAGPAEGLSVFLSILFSLNLLLGTFNLLPVAPLDGNSAIGLILPQSTALRFKELTRTPMLSLIGLILAWNLFDEIFIPIFRVAMNVLYLGL